MFYVVCYCLINLVNCGFTLFQQYMPIKRFEAEIGFATSSVFHTLDRVYYNCYYISENCSSLTIFMKLTGLLFVLAEVCVYVSFCQMNTGL